jgi:transcriptional regulator with XRE-family HTH domain
MAITGAKVREQRLALGLTQQGLADILGVSRNTVARWEREEMAIPSFLHLALKTVERESIEGESTKSAANKGPGKRPRSGKAG